MEITVKPGLPLGGFQQKILLQTNYDEAPTVEVPIRGTVGSEISIVGKGWNAKTGILMLGSVRSREGALLKLVIRTAGPHRKEVAFKPIEIFPDLLKVKVGKTTDLESGTISVTPLTILVPKGSPPADHLQMEQEKLGRIILETNHPTAHQLRILVRFAVEG
ncbi:MAG: hypothetical protein A2V98_12280 [Planctomycetes bacterium RBG_16_64_12]|nr:MAG: hypothetical protein A2V98_12280 [Planctomycetes bacterium RBG_16_64_12]